MSARLKLYTPPPAPRDDAPPSPDPDVRVRLGDLLPLVAAAQRMNYLWLTDFLDDEVAVSTDLYEVIETFRAGSNRPA
ncbi:MAG: hypothetical protein C0501_01350 [Isosphaera sp.]|nr:hypothetical protein [Isosphaera sp.]